MTNLEPDPTAFVGRESELSALAAALSECPLLTLVGAPGVGKTRIAKELARSSGVPAWFCELTTAVDADGIVSAVARALEIPLAAGKRTADAVEQIGVALARRERTLVVLDNFEHLVDEAEKTLVPWLAKAPDARFLITSRERLRIEGERVFELGPLGVGGDGVRLFVERARAVRPGFELRAGDAAFVTELVTRLDGLPLAIELAASRVGVLGVKQILDRLKRSFELLDTGALSGALEWSWQLLTEPERATLGAVSAFSGGFTADAAEAVLDLDSTLVLDALDSLRQRSLLSSGGSGDVPGEVRFSVLETVRSFAEKKLAESGSRAEVFTRHAAHFVTLGKSWADGIDGEHALEHLGHLTAERDNLRAAHRRALAANDVERAIFAITSLERFVHLREPVEAYHAMLSQAIDAAERVPTAPLVLAEALRVRSGMSMFLGRAADAIEDEERALELATRAGDRLLEARLIAALAVAGTLRKVPMLPEEVPERFGAARAGLERALELYPARDARLGVMLNNLGVVLESLGEHERARDAYDRALQCYPQGPCTSEAVALASRASLRFSAGNLPGAHADFRRALDIQRRFSDRRMEVYVLAELGALLVEQGLFAEARQHLETSLAQQRDFGFRWFEGPALAALGDLERRLGDLPNARSHYQAALDVARQTGDAKAQCRALAALGAVSAESGDLDRARSELDAAKKLADSPALEALVGIERGAINLELGRRAEREHDANLEREAVARARSATEIDLGKLRSPAVRFASSWLKARLADHLETRAGRDEATSVRITSDGRWFRMPGGEGVPLHRRHALALILKILVQHRIDLPGEGIELGALFEAGWPGERVDTHSAALRVHQAVATLRKMGLRDVLVRREDGYLLDPEKPVVRLAKPDAS